MGFGKRDTKLLCSEWESNLLYCLFEHQGRGVEESDFQAEVQALRDEIHAQHADAKELLWLRSENQLLRVELERVRRAAEKLVRDGHELLDVLGFTQTVGEEGGPGGDRP